MTRPSSTFERLAIHFPSILDDIVLHASIDPFLGPPTSLFSLLLTCRTLYNHLSVDNNSGLYARIFRQKFDCQALERRLTPKWTSSQCLAHELRSRFVALHHIKHGRPSPHLNRELLWKAYLMLLENDGRNIEQLCVWANLADWVVGVVRPRSSSLSTNTIHSMSYLSDLEDTSLAVWLLWMTSTKERLMEEPLSARTSLMNAMVPFIVRGYQYPSVFAPDSYFYLPICDEHDNIAGFSGPAPLVTRIEYLGHKLKLAVPPITSAALLNFLVRHEVCLDMLPLPTRIELLPATRADVPTRNLGAPALTQEDVVEFHYYTRTRLFQHNQVCSERLDRDWFRLVACHTPSAVERPLKGIIYPLGTLIGNWTGRIFVPDVYAYFNAVKDRRIPATSVNSSQERISCFFEEHHCLSFNEPLTAPLRSDGLGEDIFGAWLPRDMEFTRRSDGLEIYDPSTGKHTWYETYHPGSRSPYSTKACQRLSSGPSREWYRPDDPDAAMQQEDGDEDEYADYVEELPSGVQDIIITGQTCERQGEAWGYHSYIGRVRPWDGLVVLLRIPMHNQYENMGRWIFKGYVHERSLIGRWRDTATEEHAIGYEGGFILCREEENTAPMVA